jgi:hypothetical protein
MVRRGLFSGIKNNGMEWREKKKDCDDDRHKPWLFLFVVVCQPVKFFYDHERRDRKEICLLLPLVARVELDPPMSVFIVTNIRKEILVVL